jgi:post-segregation antitoxin (ccd killing protein)
MQIIIEGGLSMRALVVVALAAVSGTVPALAYDFDRDRELNVLKDIASSQREQVALAREQAQRDRERAWREGNARVNASQAAQSSPCGDRH